MIPKALNTLPKIPKGFLIGAAISAHQTEGNNIYSDWWAEEKNGRLPLSGEACDHHHRYEEDFLIARNIGLNAMRISIEWARIEPTENNFDLGAIEHYRSVLRKMKELGLVRMVTIHHFTLPLWVFRKGAFEYRFGIEKFAKFARFVAENLGNEIDIWCTINEPEVYTVQSYVKGVWPPFRKNYFKALKVFRNLTRAHSAAYKSIKSVLPNSQIGIVKNNVYYEPGGGFMGKVASCIADYFANEWFLNRIKKYNDFIGLNFYNTRTVKLGFTGLKVVNAENNPKSDMGWQTFPEGIYHALRALNEYKIPIYITENGIANAKEDMRLNYIREHISWTMKAVAEGVDVRGYFYWSLIDSYEWTSGYDLRFGLVEIDYETKERRIRSSARIFKELIFE